MASAIAHALEHLNNSYAPALIAITRKAPLLSRALYLRVGSQPQPFTRMLVGRVNFDETIYLFRIRAVRCRARRSKRLSGPAAWCSKAKWWLSCSLSSVFIDQTKLEEYGKLSDPPPVKVFHGDTVRTERHLAARRIPSDPEDRPHVVMATHQVFPGIPFWKNRGEWNLLIDEVPQVDRERTHVVPSTHPLITDHMQVQQHDGVYGRVMLRNAEEIKTLARNPDDDELLEKFRETATF